MCYAKYEWVCGMLQFRITIILKSVTGCCVQSSDILRADEQMLLSVSVDSREIAGDLI